MNGDSDIIATVLGGAYRIDRLLGVGRFASVYAATHLIDDKAVAVKIFKRVSAKKSGGGRRFLRRTRAAGLRLHPCIVPIEDRGQTDDGIPYMVMELLEGRTLEQEIAEKGALQLDRCLDIAAAMLEGLAAAHDEGLVHRDINPANVFLMKPDVDGPPVRVLDLGVATDLVDSLALSNEVIGRTRYLAPEILLTPNKSWTPALDVFAAGMVVFYALTGRLPFDKEEQDLAGDDAKTINLYQMLDSLPGPVAFAPHVPSQLDHVVRTALAVRPEERYGNAGEMAAALREIEKPVLAKSRQAPTRPENLPESQDDQNKGPPPSALEMREPAPNLLTVTGELVESDTIPWSLREQELEPDTLPLRAGHIEASQELQTDTVLASSKHLEDQPSSPADTVAALGAPKPGILGSSSESKTASEVNENAGGGGAQRGEEASAGGPPTELFEYPDVKKSGTLADGGIEPTILLGQQEPGRLAGVKKQSLDVSTGQIEPTVLLEGAHAPVVAGDVGDEQGSPTAFLADDVASAVDEATHFVRGKRKPPERILKRKSSSRSRGFLLPIFVIGGLCFALVVLAVLLSLLVYSR